LIEVKCSASIAERIRKCWIQTITRNQGNNYRMLTDTFNYISAQRA